MALAFGWCHSPFKVSFNQLKMLMISALVLLPNHVQKLYQPRGYSIYLGVLFPFDLLVKEKHKFLLEGNQNEIL